MTAKPPPFVQVYDTSSPAPAFANGYEGQSWEAAWCESCWHRDDCALLDVARLGRTPAEWVELERGSLRNRYFCKSWTAAAGYVLSSDCELS